MGAHSLAADDFWQVINTGKFDYVNLHKHYFGSYTAVDNQPAIDAARKLDMGIFIISPTDKVNLPYACALEYLVRPLVACINRVADCMSQASTCQTLAVLCIRLYSISYGCLLGILALPRSLWALHSLLTSKSTCRCCCLSTIRIAARELLS